MNDPDDEALMANINGVSAEVEQITDPQQIRKTFEDDQLAEDFEEMKEQANG